MTREFQSKRLGHLFAIAADEVEKTLKRLPPDLQAEARRLPVTYELLPGQGLADDGIEPDTLGLFVGPSFAEDGASLDPQPPQIILFVENLWDEAGEDPAVFRTEVRTTLLHELGHYLGLDEGGLELRDLD